MAGHMEKLTGHRPPTCPWRAFSHPLVREVLKIAGLAEKLGAGAIEDDTPAVVIDALHVYWSAVAAVRNHDAEERRKREEMARKRR